MISHYCLDHINENYNRLINKKKQERNGHEGVERNGHEGVGRGRNKVGRGRKGQVEVENDQVGTGRDRKYPPVPTPEIENYKDTKLKKIVKLINLPFQC